MKYEFLFIPDSAQVHADRQFSAYEIPYPTRPECLFVLPHFPRGETPPADFVVQPGVNAISEDVSHDWRWLPRTKKLRYQGHNILGAGRWVALGIKE